MSGRKILVAVSLTLFMVALYVYFSREQSEIIPKNLAGEPKVLVEEFEFFRLNSGVETSRTIGKRATLRDGGLVEVREGFRANRVRDNRREELSAVNADIELYGSNLSQLQKTETVKSAKLFQDVDLYVADTHLESEEILYKDDTKQFVSTVPVRAEQTGQYIAGDQGFVFDTATERLVMSGGITGTILPQQMQNKVPAQRK